MLFGIAARKIQQIDTLERRHIFFGVEIAHRLKRVKGFLIDKRERLLIERHQSTQFPLGKPSVSYGETIGFRPRNRMSEYILNIDMLL